MTPQATDELAVPQAAAASGRTRRWGEWLAATGLVAVAVAVRLGLTLQQWPQSNSDESTVGIMALHVATGRDFPNFYYGQSYLGSGQAYLGGALFTVFGPSLAALRAGLILLYGTFLGGLFVLARRLYSAPVALAALAVLAFGSRELFGSQLVAIGGIPETLVFGTALLLIAYRLLEAGSRPGAARQAGALAAWGAVAALGMWSDTLVAPFIAGSALLLWRARRGLPLPRRWTAAAVVAGLLAGAAPIIAHDLTAPVRRTWIATTVRLYVAGGTGVSAAESGGLGRRLSHTLGTSLAYATGGSALSHGDESPAWPKGWPGGLITPRGTLLDALWGAALVALWAWALVLTVRALRRRGDTPAGGDAPVLWGRLAVLVTAGLTGLAYAFSRTPGASPANHGRYLIGLLVAVPALIHLVTRLPRRPAVGWLVVALAVGVQALGTGQAYRDARRGVGEAQPAALAAALRDRGITRIYSDYWTCNRLVFTSGEAVACAVVDSYPDGLHHGLDRYLPYRTAVDADPAAAYVFRADGSDIGPLATAMGCAWRDRASAAGYRIWQLARPCPPLPDINLNRRN